MKSRLFEKGSRAGVGVLGLSLATAALAGSAAIPEAVRLDPRFDRLVPPGTVVQRVADGFQWVEGPVWNRAGGHLLFSDIPANAVYKWQAGEGVTLFLRPSGYSGSAPFAGREPGSNGLAYDSRGRLVLCQHGDRRIVRIEPDGRRTVLVQSYQGKRLNSPNDLVYRSDGSLYFTDPPFGLPGQFADPDRELDFSGVYRLSPDGTLTLLTKALRAPNGIAFSPDEATLYVTDVDERRPAWYAFPVLADGTLGPARIFAEAAPYRELGPGGPDGLEVDHLGNLFATGPGGVYVFAPDGTLLGRIETGVATSNVAWGEDGSVLFITASTALLRMQSHTKGSGF